MHSVAPGSGENLSPRIRDSKSSSTCVQNILPTSAVVSMSVPIHGFSQLGLRSHPIGLSTSEATTALLSFFRSDKPVYTTGKTKPVRPIGPCQRTPALAGLIFSYFRNFHSTFPGRLYDIYRLSYTGIGRPHGDFGYLDLYRLQAPYQLFGIQSGNFGLTPLHWVIVLHGHQVMIATDNTTVVSYFNKQGGTHSLSCLRLVVDLFMWLQAQDIVLRARHIPGCLNVIADRLSPISQ